MIIIDAGIDNRDNNLFTSCTGIPGIFQVDRFQIGTVQGEIIGIVGRGREGFIDIVRLRRFLRDLHLR